MKDTCRSTRDLRGLLLAIVGFALTAVTLGALAVGAQNPAGSQSPSATQTPAPTRPPTITVQNPFNWPRPNAPVPVDADPAFTQTAPEGRRGPGLLWSMRGCVLGCFLLVVLTFVVFVGVPFVLSVLSEEQQQRSVEPGPVLPR